MGLDDGMYNTIRSNILSMDPLPNLNRAYALAVQEERQRTIARGKDDRSDVVSFVTQVGLGAQAFAARTKDRSSNCGHCGKTGHEASECFQVIGYPEWWGDRPRGGGRGSGRGRGGTGGRGKWGGVRANAVRTGSTDQSTSHPDSEVRGDGFPGLSKDQWTQLMTMLKSNQGAGNVERLSGKVSSHD